MSFLSKLAGAAKRMTPRQLLVTAFACGSSLAILGPSLLAGDPPRPWPEILQDTATEISLPEALDLLETPDESRRAVVVGLDLIVATADAATWAAIDAAAAPEEAVAGAEEVDAKDTGAKDGDAKEAEASAAPADAETALPIDATSFTEAVRASLPFRPDELVTRLAETSELDFRVHYATAEGVDGGAVLATLLSLIPTILFLVLIVWMMRGMGTTKAWNVIRPEGLKHGFEAVAGIDTAQDEVAEVVEFLRNPAAASRLGGRMPNGMLLDGPPGAGKTLLARAMAKEAGVPFIALEAASVSGIIMGAGVRKVRKVFSEARKLAPCIIFIDEIDAMGRARGSVSGTVGDEKETTLNALLVELDGFESREGIFLIAATNRPEILDKALTRRGRIDRRITMTLPDLEARRKILAVHLTRVTADPALDLRAIAGTTYGFSGADLAALVNEAALMATRAKRDLVTQEDFRQARDRLLVGLSGSQRNLTGSDRRLTAVHEAGHALVASLLPEADPIEKVTIVPQGGALGFVLQSPDEDRNYETETRLKARIKVAVAGRAAEVLVLGPQAANSGASSDIEQATRVARAMVTQFGMSEAGFLKVDPQDPHFIDQTRPVISHVRAIIEGCRRDVDALLQANQDALLRIADRLEERETLSRAEVQALLQAETGSDRLMAAE